MTPAPPATATATAAATATATFVMPHYSDDPRAFQYLEETLASLRGQSDRDWRLVIVDDASPQPRDRERLREMAAASAGRIVLLQQDVNRGQGICRNIGVRWAHEQGSGIVLFQDADDLSHPRRLELTRRVLTERPEVDFIYSTFTVIDEAGAPVPENRLTPSVREIIESHHDAPVEGRDAWIRMGVETGYTTLTSTVAVRTELALAHPFPDVRGSEDGHTWFRMAAGGGALGYIGSIPSLYRIPQNVTGSSDRSRIGADYYRRKAEVDTAGFFHAMSISLQRQTIQLSDVPDLKGGFLRRLSLTMEREGQPELAREILDMTAPEPVGAR
ncbi:glycosyltransferase [Streptomyces sp. NPDC058280]|uniref:glycosyltransferase n=1 Tax=Streptomyces sp. NPDC058280 TaxID=3346419 RepID=UPI0036EC9F2A